MTLSTHQDIVEIVASSHDNRAVRLSNDNYATDLTDLDDQAWFWTSDWQEGEREADRDKEAGDIVQLSAEDIQRRIQDLHNVNQKKETTK